MFGRRGGERRWRNTVRDRLSSLCGSGDVLEALGVDIELGPESMKRCVEEVGVGFMFAAEISPGDGEGLARAQGAQGANGV